MPLALYGFGGVGGLRKLPLRVLFMLERSVKDPQVERIIKAKFYGKDAQ